MAVTPVTAADEDLAAFTATTWGEATSGTWDLYFDGSDVALTAASEDVWGVWIDANSDIYLTTQGAFAVTGSSGDGNDIRYKTCPARFHGLRFTANPIKPENPDLYLPK